MRNSSKVGLSDISENRRIASGKRPPSNALAPTAAATFFISSSSAARNKSGVTDAPVVELGLQMEPLPDLRARDFRRRRVLHQIVERHSAATAQPCPRYNCTPTRMLFAQAGFAAAALVNLQEIGAATTCTSSRPTPSLIGTVGIRRSNTSRATGTRSGWATHVPSWPLPASRSLSARTLAKARFVRPRDRP